MAGDLDAAEFEVDPRSTAAPAQRAVAPGGDSGRGWERQAYGTAVA
jgi:hypothetical protein